MSETRTLLLWGNRAVGKTSVLAAGLLHDPTRFGPPFPAIDWPASAQSLKESVEAEYARLRSNVLVVPTTDRQGIRTELTFRGGRRLVVQDVRGGLTQEPPGEEASGFLAAASAVLFVLEWASPDQSRQLLAVEQALFRAAPGRPAGLAFTKCERDLDPGDPAWDVEPATGAPADPRWWAGRQAVTRDAARVLDRLAGPVWPTSVYGYNQDDRPACLLDEFGELIPFGIQPRNVADVLGWFFTQMGM